MREELLLILVGQPNAGKSLFFLNFLGDGGASVTALSEERSDSWVPVRFTWEGARRQLVDDHPHHTRSPWRASWGTFRGRRKTPAYLVDTGGIANGIHPDPRVRDSMARTLLLLGQNQSRAILHILDAAQVGQDPAGWDRGGVARALDQAFGARKGYVILANKMDLPWADHGLWHLERQFPGRYIIPVSALARRGFREVRGFLRGQVEG